MLCSGFVGLGGFPSPSQQQRAGGHHCAPHRHEVQGSVEIPLFWQKTVQSGKWPIPTNIHHCLLSLGIFIGSLNNWRLICNQKVPPLLT